MNTENVGSALKKKLGPFPVWVWAIVGGFLLYFLRSRSTATSSTGGSVQATTAEAQLIQAEAAASAATLQSPQILAQGETVYDPNTGFLSSVPNDGLNEGLLGLISGLVLPQGPAPKNTAANHKHGKAPKGSGPPHAPGGAKKPKAPKGYHTVGKGHGRWQFVKNGKPPKSTKHKKHHHKSGGN